MTELLLSALSQAEITIESGERNETNDHATLKNLGFDDSGHTGFQKELTEEQLANIDAVSGKEDVSNKVTELSKNSTDEQYPSAKCVYGLIGDIETALDNIITTQNTLIGGESV